MEQMKAQAEHVGTRIVNDIITEVNFGSPAIRPDGRFRHDLHRRSP